MSVLELQRRDLETLGERQRLRRLTPRCGIDFSSNDYLGLANSPELSLAALSAVQQGTPIGSGGSRLLRGNHEEHEALEAAAARFFGSESALYFSSGFAANSTLIATLPQRGDRIFYDELIHASIHDGLRLSRAYSQAVPHNDASAFRDALSHWRRTGNRGRPWIVVESLYSMEGDLAPLTDLWALAQEEDAFLIVDEAHATGVFGSQGRGLAAQLEGQEQVITIRTCGKALGCEGALVCGSAVVRDFLVNRGRGFIFSTAPSPLMAALVRSALNMAASSDRRDRLLALMTYAQERLSRLGATSCSQIIPLIVGDDSETMRLASELQTRGFDIRGIRPPTVPEGTSRLRISLTLNVEEQDVDALCSAIAELRN